MKKFTLFAALAWLAVAGGLAPHAAAQTSGLVDKMFPARGVGAVPRTFAGRAQDNINVKDFGAKCDGVTNDLAAMNKAAAALRDNQELHFPKGKCKLAWAGAKPEKSTIAIDLFHLKNIKLIGHGTTIMITGHDVGLYGGLLFARIRASQNVEVYGFDVQMSFVGSNKQAAYYPESGFLYAHNITENATAWPVPMADRLENISVHDVTFNIQSQYGAYATSQNPYQGDGNNGGKYYSVFIRGEQAESTYAGQNKGVKLTGLTYADTHQAYGVWVWGFSNVEISRNQFQGWATRTGDYQNTTLGGSVPAIRCHKFFTRNWSIEGNIIQSRPAALRTGAMDGGGALVSFQQEATAYDPQSNVTIANNTFVVGSNLAGAPVEIHDTGIELKAGGNYELSRNTFASNASLPGGNGITINDYYSASGTQQYVNVNGNTFLPSAQALYSLAYASASNTSATDRSLRSLVFTNNTVNGYYKNVVVRASQGRTFEGVPFQVVSDNRINGAANTLIVPANVTNIPLDIYVEQPADAAQVSNNLVSSSYVGVRISGPSSQNATAVNNNIVGAVQSNIVGAQNYAPKSLVTLTTFTSAQPVVVQGDPRAVYSVIGMALDATGLVKDKIAGNYSGGTVLVPAPTGYTWNLWQFEIAR